MHLLVRMFEERFHRDDEGRPLREGRTPPELVRPGEIEYRTCPYAGSRLQHRRPMNVSALRQTGTHWDDVIEALAFVRTHYARTAGRFGPDVLDLWRVSQLGSALPWFFLFRDGGQLPAYAAALSKATLGTGILGMRLSTRALAAPTDAPPLTARTIFELAEATGTLVGDTEVCAASENMLMRFFETIVAGEPVGHGRAAELAATRDQVLLFGAHYTAFKLVLWISYLARRMLYADIIAVGAAGWAAAITPDGDARGTAGVTRAAELRAGPCQPADFFLVEPEEPAALPLDHRAFWFSQLADQLVPFAPDGSDVAIRAGLHELAAAMGLGAGVDPVPRTLVTYARIDAVFADLVGTIEAGLCRAVGAPEPTPLDAATRDRLVEDSARALFTSLAPSGFAAICRP